ASSSIKSSKTAAISRSGGGFAVLTRRGIDQATCNHQGHELTVKLHQTKPLPHKNDGGDAEHDTKQ
ncbi:MAG: hypothetical protein ACK5KM_10255, partial [Hyphomicrobiaceae bacterium]